MSGQLREIGSAEDCADGPVACGACDLSELCSARKPVAGNSGSPDRRGRWARAFTAKAYVLRAGRPAHTVYAVRHGVLKTVRVTPAGDERVVAFHLPGDILGLDALATGRYGGDVIALTPCALCELPVPRLHRWLDDTPRLARSMLQLVSRLATEGANGCDYIRGPVRQRVTGFLNDLSARLERRGYDGRRFLLRMTRKDMASYLDTRLETISRIMHQLHAEGRAHIVGRRIQLTPS